MKKLLLFLFLGGAIPVAGIAQTQTISYNGDNAVNGGFTAPVDFSYLSTCQQAITLDGSAGVYDGVSWSSLDFSLVVNGTNIGTYPSPTTVDLTSYIPITSLQVISNAGTWHSVGALLNVTSNSASAPPAPAVANVGYCQNASSSPLTAGLSGSGVSLRWYTSALGYGYSTTAPTPNTTTLGTTSWWVSQIDAGGCESLRSQIAVTVSPATSDQSVTATSSSLCPNNGTTISVGSSENGVYYYLRDDSNNSIVDGPTNGNGSGISFNTGNLSSTTTFNVFAEGAKNALDFDGLDDQAQATGINIANSSFTIEAWAKRNSTGSYDFIFGQGNTANDQGLHFGFRNSDQFTFAFYGDDITTTATYTDNNWHHWAGTYDATTNTQNLYLDGVLIETRTAGGDYFGSGTLYIGDASWGGGNFNGTIDEARIWNSVRSQTDISNNMNMCLNGNESNLIAYYKFNEMSGSIQAEDNSNNNNNAVLSGMDPATDWVLGAFSCHCDAELTTLVTITVEDTQAPVISNCPSNISINANQSGCSADVTWNAPTANDNCTGSVTPSSTHNPGDNFALGTTTVTYTFDDGNGNQATCSFTVEVTNDLSGSSVDQMVSCNGANDGAIDATIIGGTSPYSVSWTGPNGFTSTSEDITGLEPGQYIPLVTDANGCTTTGSVDITEPLALLPSETHTDETAGGNDGTIDLTVTDGTGPYTFAWTGPGGFTSTSEDLTGLAGGTYDVTVTDANGCTTTMQVTVLSSVGISEISENSIMIYPNPTSGMFIVKTNSANSTIKIMDVTGRLVMAKETTNSTNTFDLSETESGVYFVQVKNGNEIKTVRLVLQK